MRPLRRLLPLAVLAAALLTPASASAAELGLNVVGGPAATQGDLDQLSDTGARWARHFFYTNLDEHGIREFGRIADEEGRRGVRTLLVVVGPGGQPPADHQAYADYLGRAARELAGRVDAYEIWNEQDEPTWWNTGPNASAYVDLLRRANAAVKAADPNATVLFGPTTGNNYAFVDAAYHAGARGHFDAMAVHTDTACLTDGPTSYYRENGRIARFTFLGHREVRQVMLAHGDDKPIWMTEFGWSAAQHVCDRGEKAGQKPAGVSEADQARFLREAMGCLREDPYVQVAMWFTNRDEVGDGRMDNTYGLRRHDGSNRPAYAAFQDVARNGARLDGPCGDFVAPRVQVQSPAPGTRFGARDSLGIRAVSPDSDVLRMTFAIQGRGSEIRNFTNSGNPLNFANPPFLDWQGARQLPYGRHTLVVSAVDRQGNVGTARVPVERVNPRSLRAAATSVARLRLTGRGRRRTLSGRVTSRLRFQIGGKVRVEWQARRGRRWRRIHGAERNANRPFSFTQRLRYSGRWRARVTYRGQHPFRRSTSRWVSFRVR